MGVKHAGPEPGRPASISMISVKAYLYIWPGTPHLTDKILTAIQPSLVLLHHSYILNMANPLLCDNVTPACPVEASIYGYYPNTFANYFFAAFFGLFTFLNMYLGWRYRTWTYMIGMGLGCLSSCIGYAGRIMLHTNPFNSTAFKLQITLLIIAPAYLSAAIYLTLKHICLCFGERWSRIRPRFYTWIFIIADSVSLALQGAGVASRRVLDKMPNSAPRVTISQWRASYGRCLRCQRLAFSSSILSYGVSVHSNCIRTRRRQRQPSTIPSSDCSPSGWPQLFLVFSSDASIAFPRWLVVGGIPSCRMRHYSSSAKERESESRR